MPRQSELTRRSGMSIEDIKTVIENDCNFKVNHDCWLYDVAGINGVPGMNTPHDQRKVPCPPQHVNCIQRVFKKLGII